MDPPQYQDELGEQVARKEQRKMKARREQNRSVWYGLGMFGLVGWSIAVPTLIGIAVGIWIDRTFQHKYSCTLMCLFVGVVVGCSIAWYWVKRESLTEVDSDDDESVNESDSEQRGGQV
ncbi:MAG: ATP synthase subunit [Planctomycetota bacterium]|nr:MAG: ATP synthase subunit [Planctomycetota bacterium]REJ89710.1 MAG: ATP synthase subunit [Planctomycetota bacterium]REK26644.1 MAG: ATP synthase subunit [Planctomycetota bacterium]REK47326.1 MAG: ATP synthase subunit [Planctomycetota bacterium]